MPLRIERIRTTTRPHVHKLTTSRPRGTHFGFALFMAATVLVVLELPQINPILNELSLVGLLSHYDVMLSPVKGISASVKCHWHKYFHNWYYIYRLCAVPRHSFAIPDTVSFLYTCIGPWCGHLKIWILSMFRLTMQIGIYYLPPRPSKHLAILLFFSASK